MSHPFHLPSCMGHRGALGLAPENTLAGLDAAAAAGCAWVEVDVMLSRDGVPVLHHDHALRRLAGDRRQLETLDAAELAGLDVGSHFDRRFAGEGIPTLAAALDRMAELRLQPNLELKPAKGAEAATAAAAVEVLQSRWGDRRGPALLSSFNRTSLAAAQRHAPEVPRGLIADRVPRDWRRALAELGCVSLHLGRRHLTLHRCEAVKKAGYGLAVYTVNDTVEAQAFRRWGVDCIITDRPDRVAGALAQPLPPVRPEPAPTA